MKRIFSILFLAVILFQSFSSLYVLGTFYMNRAYISSNLCENRFDAVKLCAGKCYLAKELKKEEKQQEKFPDLKQKEINLYCEEITLHSPASGYEPAAEPDFLSGVIHYSTTYLSSVFHPPRLT